MCEWVWLIKLFSRIRVKVVIIPDIQLQNCSYLDGSLVKLQQSLYHSRPSQKKQNKKKKKLFSACLSFCDSVLPSFCQQLSFCTIAPLAFIQFCSDFHHILTIRQCTLDRKMIVNSACFVKSTPLRAFVGSFQNITHILQTY